MGRGEMYKDWIIFDLDGTLANIEHRLPHIYPPKGEKKDWRAFEAACPDDRPIEEMVHLCRLLFDFGYKIAIVTGRSDNVRLETETWLRNWRVPFNELHMRPAGRVDHDEIIKEEIFLSYFANRGVLMVFDDRQRVVNKWRQLGLRCCQVAEGNF